MIVSKRLYADLMINYNGKTFAFFYETGEKYLRFSEKRMLEFGHETIVKQLKRMFKLKKLLSQ